MATKQQIQEVKARVDIVELIGRYVKLKRVGKNWAGLCPFHNERTPSFFVNPQLNIYKCFGCGKAGDAISFLQEIEHIDFYEALSRLAKEVGVKLSVSGDPKEHKKIERARALLGKVTELYQYLLLKHKVGKYARSYVKKRDIPVDIIKEFKLGYAPTKKDLVLGLSKKWGYTKQELILAGLINDKGKDKFFNRLMFPIFDTAGHIVGFSGRVITPNDFRAKYLNTAETPIFRKRFILYGLYQAKQNIVKNDKVVLVEGQIDVLSSFKAGINYTVAPLGTGLTDSQIMLLARYTKNIVFALDNDEAGKRSLERGVSMALAHGMNVYVVKLPDSVKDVDELVNKDKTLWPKIVEESIDFFDARIAELKEIINQNDYSLFEKKLVNTLSILKNANELKQEAVLKKFSQALDIPIETLRTGLKRKEVFNEVKNKGSKNNAKFLSPLDYFVGLLILFPVLWVKVNKDSDLQDCLPLYYEDIYKTISTFVSEVTLMLKEKYKNIDNILELNSLFFKEFKEDYRINVLEALKLTRETLDIILKVGLSAELKNVDFTTDVVEEFLQITKRLKKRCFSEQITKLQQEIVTAELKNDEEQLQDLTKKVLELTQKLNKL